MKKAKDLTRSAQSPEHRVRREEKGWLQLNDNEEVIFRLEELAALVEEECTHGGVFGKADGAVVGI